MTSTFHILSGGPGETQHIGQSIGELACPGDIFLLNGPLGAGKTCFTQGLAKGLGVTGYVRSPTFVLVTQHQGRLRLFHVDLYRIDDPREAWDLGLDEQLFGEGVCVVEWAEKASDIFPPEGMRVELDYYRRGPDDAALQSENRRALAFHGGPAHYRGVLEELAAKYPSTQGEE